MSIENNMRNNSTCEMCVDRHQTGETSQATMQDTKAQTMQDIKTSTIAINVETQDYTVPLPGESCQHHIAAITHRYGIAQSHRLPTKHT